MWKQLLWFFLVLVKVREKLNLCAAAWTPGTLASLNMPFYSRKPVLHVQVNPLNPGVLLVSSQSFSPCPLGATEGTKKNLPQALVLCVWVLHSSWFTAHRDWVTGRWGLFDVINANKQHHCFVLREEARFSACLCAHCSVSSRRRALLGRKNVMFLMLLPGYFGFPSQKRVGRKCLYCGGWVHM